MDTEKWLDRLKEDEKTLKDPLDFDRLLGDLLNLLGREGWELVGMTPNPPYPDGRTPTFPARLYLKKAAD